MLYLYYFVLNLENFYLLVYMLIWHTLILFVLVLVFVLYLYYF
jgi:hypothetical protein